MGVVELPDMTGAGVSPGEDMAMGERAIIEENFTGFRESMETEGGKIGGDVDVTAIPMI